MLPGKPDISFIEVDTPDNRWCSSGHQAPATFKRGGADSPEEPTKFFLVKGNGVNTTICEPCLMIANYLASLQRKNKKEK